MTKTLLMVSHKNHYLSVDKGFVNFLTSKLITCFIDGFTSKMKSQSIVYLLNGSEHIYWILDLQNGVHSIWILWTNNLQECKGQAKVGGRGSSFFDVALAHHLDACNARRECVERPCFQCKDTTIEIKSSRHISDKWIKVILWIK